MRPKHRTSQFTQFPLPTINDPEAEMLPAGLSRVIDAHVHLFPKPLFQAIWKWFGQYAWPVRYQMRSRELLEFLFSRGIEKIVGLHYAHKPGIARDLNKYMAGLVKEYQGKLIGTATIYPGEPKMTEILTEAFDTGLVGVKLHVHVQYFDPRSPEAHEIYDLCQRLGHPLIIHVGRAPKSPLFDYPIDPYTLCNAAYMETILKQYPALRVCVPHLGADEFADYERIVRQHDNLYLDTSMALASYMPVGRIPDLGELPEKKIMFGSDFPNIPFAWNHELDELMRWDLPRTTLEAFLSKNAESFYRVQPT